MSAKYGAIVVNEKVVDTAQEADINVCLLRWVTIFFEHFYLF